MTTSVPLTTECPTHTLPPFPDVPMEAVCECGEQLWRVAGLRTSPSRWERYREPLAEWHWVDTVGRTSRRRGIPTEFLPHLYGTAEWWDRLLEASPEVYSFCSMTLGGDPATWAAITTHTHRPCAEAKTCTSEVPWCHGEPMHATPQGWRCRATGLVQTYGKNSTDQAKGATDTVCVESYQLALWAQP